MKHLRQYIRRLIIESGEHQRYVGNMMYTRPQQWRPEEEEEGVYHKDYAETTAQKYSGGNAQQDYVDLRRDIKRYWNEHADHDFWQSGIVTVVHDLGYYGLNDAEYQDMPILDFIKKYPPGVIQKDEMSAYGFLPKWRGSWPALGVILKGRITFAHENDAWTESRSKMTKQDEERYKSSGIPKRPGIAEDFNEKYILFDQTDLYKRKIGELIVDNWTYDTAVLDRERILKSKNIFSHSPGWKKANEQLDDIEEQLKKAGLKIIEHNPRSRLRRRR